MGSSPAKERGRQRRNHFGLSVIRRCISWAGGRQRWRARPASCCFEWSLTVRADAGLSPGGVSFLITDFPHRVLPVGTLGTRGPLPQLALCSVSWMFCVFVIKGTLHHPTVPLGIYPQLHHFALGTTQFIKPWIWKQEIQPDDPWSLFVAKISSDFPTYNLTTGTILQLPIRPLHGKEFNKNSH